MEVKKGQIYRHFKGDTMEIVAVAKHSETLEDMVVYKHNDTVWVRPYAMFIEKVDKNKYPNCTQEYRFELLKDINDWSWRNRFISYWLRWD